MEPVTWCDENNNLIFNKTKKQKGEFYYGTNDRRRRQGEVYTGSDIDEFEEYVNNREPFEAPAQTTPYLERLYDDLAVLKQDY